MHLFLSDKSLLMWLPGEIITCNSKNNKSTVCNLTDNAPGQIIYHYSTKI